LFKVIEINYPKFFGEEALEKKILGENFQRTKKMNQFFCLVSKILQGKKKNDKKCNKV